MPYLVPLFIEEIILKITFVNFELLNSLDISASVIPKLNDMSGHSGGRSLKRWSISSGILKFYFRLIL